ncbi:MAG TPA: hypothetical protein VHD90_00200 [Phototrophicaceae bacterium]|nr:hypothetical protein [Phototrophicaceae bacterium]
MDAVTLYRLGQIRQQEILDEAMQQYAEVTDRPSLWSRLTARLSTLRPQREDRRENPQQKQALA